MQGRNQSKHLNSHTLLHNRVEHDLIFTRWTVSVLYIQLQILNLFKRIYLIRLRCSTTNTCNVLQKKSSKGFKKALNIRTCLKRDAVVMFKDAQLQAEGQKRMYKGVAGRLRGKIFAGQRSRIKQHWTAAIP